MCVADGARQTIKADIIVNAAGPFACARRGDAWRGALPIVNVLQQKIAFADRNRAVDRKMPFAIDLDGQTLAWSADEREALGSGARAGAPAGADAGQHPLPPRRRRSR